MIDERSGAVVSPCGFYRLRLWRRWDLEKRVLLWIMLNPSTADASVDDPTILAICDFARRWGYGGIEVVNLYSYRTKSPEVLKSAGYPIGPGNNLTISALVQWRAEPDQRQRVICAWGSKAQPERALAVYDMISEFVTPCALAVNKDGTPKHPLYVKRDTVPSFYDIRYPHETLW